MFDTEYCETTEGFEALIGCMGAAYGLARPDAVSLINRNADLLRGLARARVSVARAAEDVMEREGRLP